MNWSSFGIDAPPFQLTPDTRFYFNSAGHRRALEALRQGLIEPSGLLVLTGSIGAGKTTVVRTMLTELDAVRFAVAHVVSTQLGPDELLSAALIGFGAIRERRHVHGPEIALRRYVAALQTQGRRAVLVVDEAQHLARETFERLLTLLTDRAPPPLPLQILLVGQPELRVWLDSKDATEIARAISVACEIGPIGLEETGPYVEHRLRKVGWRGSPSFAQDAYDEIYWRTRGIPRRINLLCNRLLFSQLISGVSNIERASVIAADDELRAEFGIEGPAPALPRLTTVIDDTLSQLRPRAARGSGNKAFTAKGKPASRPVLCLVEGFGDHIRAASLMRTFGTRPRALPSSLVRVYADDAIGYFGALYSGLGVCEHAATLGLSDGTCIEPAGLDAAFAAALDTIRPGFVVVFASTPTTLACATLAHTRHISVVHAAASPLGPIRRDASVRKALNLLADTLFAPTASIGKALIDEGVATDCVHCVGSLLADAVHFASGLLAASSVNGREAVKSARRYFDSPRGYALVVIGDELHSRDRGAMTELVELLCDVARVLPLVWPMRSRLHQQLKKFRLESVIAKEPVRRLPTQLYLDYIALLQNAACVLTDSAAVQEEAGVLGVACLALGAFAEPPPTSSRTVAVGMRGTLAISALWDILSDPKPGAEPLSRCDAAAGERMADLMAARLQILER